METLVAIVIVGVILAGALLIKNYLHKKRVAALTQWAQANGWHYQEHGGRVFGRFVGEPFGRGFGRKARHMLTAQVGGRQVIAFEYLYKERRGSGKNRRTVTYTFEVVTVRTPAQRPMLEVSQENVFTKIGNVVGFKDLQLESEQFNRLFRIRADNDKFAYDVLHPQTMEWMMADPRAQDVPFRFEQTEILTWAKGKLHPDRVVASTGYLIEHVNRVPAFVWQ